jgi:hypothetical protein
MKMFVEPADIYLYMDIVDFRKSINGLIIASPGPFRLNPISDFRHFSRQLSHFIIKQRFYFQDLMLLYRCNPSS